MIRQSSAPAAMGEGEAVGNNLVRGGGGGGSFNGGSNPSNTGGVQTGHGQVIFTW